MVGQALDRALASGREIQPSARAATRAAARHEPGTMQLTPGELRCCRWQTRLDPEAAWRDKLEALDGRERRVVQLRYGWAGAPPQTIIELAGLLECPPAAAAATLRRAEGRLREVCRRA